MPERGSYKLETAFRCAKRLKLADVLYLLRCVQSLVGDCRLFIYLFSLNLHNVHLHNFAIWAFWNHDRLPAWILKVEVLQG